MLVHNDILQGSEEWHALRLGKITGSSFHKLTGTTLAKDKYLMSCANEIVTGARCDSDEVCSNIHIIRGNEFEDIARMKYTVVTLNEVSQVGFIELNEFIGCSPDGLVGNNGMIEIKVPDSNNYFSLLINISKDGKSAIPKDHLMQMQFCMYVAGRAWCDYVLYNPKHEAQGKGLLVFRVERDEETIEVIKNILIESIEQIKAYVSQYFGYPTVN